MRIVTGVGVPFGDELILVDRCPVLAVVQLPHKRKPHTHTHTQARTQNSIRQSSSHSEVPGSMTFKTKWQS